MRFRTLLLLACALAVGFSFLTSGSNEAVILFLGDSLSAGYGIDPEQAFPALIQKRLQTEERSYRVVNAGVSGETSAGGLRRLNWLLRQRIEIFVLELGANDGLRGVALEETRNNLDAILKRVQSANPEVRLVVAGMKLPPNLGAAYLSGFEAIFRDLAKKHDAVLIPFLLKGVAGRPNLNQPDGIHPTPEGHEIVAETVWEYLEPLLG